MVAPPPRTHPSVSLGSARATPRSGGGGAAAAAGGAAACGGGGGSGGAFCDKSSYVGGYNT